MAQVDRYAAALGLPLVRMLADVVAFMTACQLLVAAPSEDGKTRYRLNPTRRCRTRSCR
jgi:hypothetical protein